MRACRPKLGRTLVRILKLLQGLGLGLEEGRAEEEEEEEELFN